MGSPDPADDGPRVGEVPYGCEGTFRMIANAPNCYDGSGNRPTDVVFRKKKPCPSGYVRIPDVRAAIDFLPPDGTLDAPVEVSTGMGSWGAASTFHFDMMPGDRQGDGDGGQTLGGERKVKICVLDMPKGSTAPGSSTPQPPPNCYRHWTGGEI